MAFMAEKVNQFMKNKCLCVDYNMYSISFMFFVLSKLTLCNDALRCCPLCASRKDQYGVIVKKARVGLLYNTKNLINK